jgi:hypothetical protein
MSERSEGERGWREARGRRETRPLQASRRGGSNLITAACVALGCWGFAFSFAFLTDDPNRYVYGGMAAALGVMWAVLFAMRLRKRLQQG